MYPCPLQTLEDVFLKLAEEEELGKQKKKSSALASASVSASNVSPTQRMILNVFETISIL